MKKYEHVKMGFSSRQWTPIQLLALTRNTAFANLNGKIPTIQKKTKMKLPTITFNRLATAGIDYQRHLRLSTEIPVFSISIQGLRKVLIQDFLYWNETREIKMHEKSHQPLNATLWPSISFFVPRSFR